MAIILNIDTATETAHVCIADGDKILSFRSNEDAKQHASFVQQAIQEVSAESKITLKEIDAVAVSNGPGSYTGLRVGLSTAKGICYALDKPLILINTLLVIADTVAKEANDETLICAMIDARRAEVFTAIYDASLKEIFSPQPVILDEDSFGSFLQTKKLLFAGSGVQKTKSIITHSNAFFSDKRPNAFNLNNLAQSAFSNRVFADLAYSEPFYIKPFFDTHKL